MRRAVKWVILILLLAAYGYIVYGWWTEGTENFERQRRETCAEHYHDGTPAKAVPNGCLELYNYEQ